MQTLVYEGTVTALSSVSHNGGQSFGIESKLRRERFVQPDGTVEEVPVLSGNGMRGMLRDRGMWHMCQSLGYGINEEEGKVQGLSLSAFYFLFSGGALTDSGSGGIDVDYARRLREAIPLISIFGGAVGAQILPGKLKVGKAIPICAETLHLLPQTYQERVAPSIWDFLQTEMYTRKDDERNEKLRTVIEGKALKQIAAAPVAEAPALFADATPIAEVAAEIEKRRPQQMMYLVETFAAGTLFYWKLVLEDVTDVEYDAFMTTLAEFSKTPYVGGKSAVGLGEVAVKFDKWLQIDSRLQAEVTAIARPVGAAYHDHLQTRGADIRAILETV
jgi:CRISPR type IV-associated protein Csf2